MVVAEWALFFNDKLHKLMHVCGELGEWEKYAGNERPLINILASLSMDGHSLSHISFHQKTSQNISLHIVAPFPSTTSIRMHLYLVAVGWPQIHIFRQY